MIWLATFLGNEKLARRVALIGGLAFAAMAVLAIRKCSYDRRVIAQHDAKVSAKVRPADDRAAAAREADHIEIANDPQEIANALAPLPDAPLTDRQRARACAIWMRQHPGAAKPAGC